MADHRLRILHLSDLHERVALPWMDEPRKRKIELNEAGRARVLEEQFFQILSELHTSSPIDIVCFTGDVADWGLPEEYTHAESLIRQILEVVHIPVERFFLVPGNHDIQRTIAENEWKEMRSLTQELPEQVSIWMGGCNIPRGATPEWRDAILERTRAFWDWVCNSLGRPCLHPSKNPHKRLGYRQTLDIDLPFPINIIGLDSAWLCGDDSDCQNIHLTQHQIDMLTRNGRQHLDGFRLVLVHHPLGHLADYYKSRQILATTADLLLHGHQHDPVIEEMVDPDRNLRVIAAGSLYEGDLGDRWKNSFHVIDVVLNESGRPLQYDVDFWGWSDRGFWHKDGSLYRAAQNGHYSWLTPLGKTTMSNTRRLLTATGIEVGKTETVISSAIANQIATEVNQRDTVPPQSEFLTMLTDKITELLKSFRYQEVTPFAVELEKQLKATVSKGMIVREGWIALAKIEQHNLRMAKQLKQPVNVARLKEIYQEAQNVVD